MSTHGFPDLETPPPPHGIILEQQNGIVVPVAPANVDVGQVEVAGYRSVTLLANVAGNPIDYTIVWRMFSPANGLTFTTTGTLAVGMNAPLIRCLAHQVAHIYLSGSGGGATADVAVVGSNLDPLASSAPSGAGTWYLAYQNMGTGQDALYNVGADIVFDTLETSDPANITLITGGVQVRASELVDGFWLTMGSVQIGGDARSFRTPQSADLQLSGFGGIDNIGGSAGREFGPAGNMVSLWVAQYVFGNGGVVLALVNNDPNWTAHVSNASVAGILLAPISSTELGGWPAF